MGQALALDFEMLIKRLNTERDEATSSEAKRAYSIAITNAETAQLWCGRAFQLEMVAPARQDPER